MKIVAPIFQLFQNIHDPLSQKKGNSEVEKFKKLIIEKDEIIENNTMKIAKLEETIKQLQDDSQLDERTKLNKEMYDILIKYEKLISSTLVSYDNEKKEKIITQNHLTCLELAFHDLIQKYERAKEIILGFQKNEKILLTHIGEFETDVEKLKMRYLQFKKYAVNTINEANATINKITEENATQIQEMEKKLEYADQKIRFLEENSKNNNTFSIFEPLVTNLK